MPGDPEITRRSALRTVSSAAAVAGGLGIASGSAAGDDHYYDPDAQYCWEDDAATSPCASPKFDRFERVAIKEEKVLPNGSVVEMPGEVGLRTICSEPQNPADLEFREIVGSDYVPTGAKGIVLDKCWNNSMYLVDFYDAQNDCNKVGHVAESMLENATGGYGADIC